VGRDRSRCPATVKELGISEAPDRTIAPDRAEGDNVMTTAAPTTPAPLRARPVEFIFSILGLIVALLALPFVLLFDGPYEGWLLGAALFAASWAAGMGIAKVSLSMPPTHAVGISGISFILRAWIIVAILFVVAKQWSEPIGLAAAGVFLAAFSFDLFGRIILHSMRVKGQPQGPLQ
jgi:hypothetical protein